MGKEKELHYLLTRLVEAWPEDDDHPAIERAREYLNGRSRSGSRSLAIDDRPAHSTDQNDAMWFSI
jgi:hypothetical protein